jgi:hypothetical protein
MTAQFVEAMKTALYKGYTKEQENLLGDPIRFIRSENDSYIRKSDGVIVGNIKLNGSKTILQDRLYDIVQIDNPIPDEEFSIPNGTPKVATTMDQFTKINFNRIQEEKLGQITTKSRWIRPTIIGTMVFSVGILLWVIKRQISSKNVK